MNLWVRSQNKKLLIPIKSPIYVDDNKINYKESDSYIITKGGDVRMNKSVMKCCICNNENIGKFITINNKKYHLCCIEQLQQENKKLNGTIQTYDILLKANVEENKRLKDNWNKLKEYIQKDYDLFSELIDPKYGCATGALSRVKDKMQEIEQGSDSNKKPL